MVNVCKSQPNFHSPLGRCYSVKLKSSETKMKFHKIRKTTLNLMYKERQANYGSIYDFYPLYLYEKKPHHYLFQEQESILSKLNVLMRI